MARRIIIRFLELVGGLAAGIALVIGLVIGFLATTQAEIDFLTSEIEAVLNNMDLPVNFDIGNSKLAWGGWDQALEINLGNVAIKNQDQVKIAAFDQLSIDLDVGELLKGQIALSRLELDKPIFYFKRDKDGKFQVVLPGNEQQLPDLAQSLNSKNEEPAVSSNGFHPEDLIADISVVFELFNEFELIGGRHAALSKLEAISIYQAAAVFDDYSTYKRWEAENVSFSLTRGVRETFLDAFGTLKSSEREVGFNLGLVHPVGTKELGLTLDVEGLNGDFIAFARPEVATYVGNMPSVGVKLTGSIDASENTRGIFIQGDLTTPAGPIATELSYGFGVPSIDIAMSTTGLDVETFSSFGPALKVFNPLSGRLTIDANTSFDPSNWKIAEAAIEISGDEAKLELKELFEEELSLSEIDINIAIGEDLSKIEIGNAKFSIPDANLTFAAFLTRENSNQSPDGSLTDSLTVNNLGDYHLDFDIRGQNFDMKHLHKYWPTELGRDARDWVVPNIDVGFVPEVTFNLEGRLSEQLSRFELLDFGGAIMFEEAAV
ncbi:MAG: hypothetical protein R3261_06705, partial [Alphaproteobacteria bacterium]|nr:hypothetical protein [Alphaproteobacteria bacterium]